MPFLTVVLGPGALSRAFLTLPPSKLKKLIILEDYEPYLEYLRVCFHRLWSIFIVECSILASCPSGSSSPSRAYERLQLGHIFLFAGKRGS